MLTAKEYISGGHQFVSCVGCELLQLGLKSLGLRSLGCQDLKPSPLEATLLSRFPAETQGPGQKTSQRHYVSPQWNLQSISLAADTKILPAVASVFISQTGAGALPHLPLLPHLYLPPGPWEKVGHRIFPGQWAPRSVSCLVGSMALGGSPPRGGRRRRFGEGKRVGSDQAL